MSVKQCVHEIDHEFGHAVASIIPGPVDVTVEDIQAPSATTPQQGGAP